MYSKNIPLETTLEVNDSYIGETIEQRLRAAKLDANHLRNAQSSNLQIFKSSNLQIFKSSNLQIFKSQDIS